MEIRICSYIWALSTYHSYQIYQEKVKKEWEKAENDRFKENVISRLANLEVHTTRNVSDVIIHVDKTSKNQNTIELESLSQPLLKK